MCHLNLLFAMPFNNLDKSCLELLYFTEMTDKLHFHGPYKFFEGDNYLFESEFNKSEGIYLWTVKQKFVNIV